MYIGIYGHYLRVCACNVGLCHSLQVKSCDSRVTSFMCLLGFSATVCELETQKLPRLHSCCDFQGHAAHATCIITVLPARYLEFGLYSHAAWQHA